MMSDASEMLAAALEQMDGIIAGSKAINFSNGLFDCQSPSSPLLGSLRAVHLLEDLRGALELMDADERENLRSHVPDNTAESLVEWLQARLTNGHGFAAKDLAYQERLSRLENDKECLVLQVSVLTDQVEVQGEKIRDLEMCLEEHQMKLNATEELLQQELLSRSTLETQKLELLTEISSLKLKLTTADHESKESEAFYQELSEMRFRAATAEKERMQQEGSLKSTREELVALQKQLEEQEQDLRKLKKLAGAEAVTSDGSQSNVKDLEVQKMKQTVESLMACNNEKDRKIEELQQSLLNCGKIQDMVMLVKERKDCVLSDRDDEEDTRTGQSESSAKFATTTVTETLSPTGTEQTDEPQVIPCTEFISESEHKSAADADPCLPTPSFSERLGAENLSSGDEAESSESADKMMSSPTVSPSQLSPGGSERFGSKKIRSSFGRGFFKIRGGKRTTSSPDLAAETERKRTEHLDLAGAPSLEPKEHAVSPEGKKKSKGFRKFLGMMRRSQSTSSNLDDESEFKRGGLRATAGPRLGWSRDSPRSNNNELETPFASWSTEQVCEWLQEQDLGLYMGQAQQWVSSGQTLLNASQNDLEKELGIRHPLHRKKLLLALQALSSEEGDSKSKLDFNWVNRWLDDIGLPQYKAQFEEGRVDARMLHYMTVDDLLGLKVGSVLHHLSIKRAIQVLRINNYEPNCLRRRPSDENNITPEEVCQWTNHRVMEWLRSVDLAEYAPNLRGSGVHGGLMVLEPRFSVETMALLLNIPPNKTLLRRHLATHFHLLIGAEAERLKQECLEHPDYTLLTATAKVKPRRLSFGGFGTLRRKRQEDSEEFLCPLDVQKAQNNGEQCISEDKLEQMEDSEGAVKQIGAFSDGINNLTSILKKDELFREMPSHSPDATYTDSST
ncbi:liprin-beta-1 isoform X1 [Silurus meridionalis]|uniref:liprin-beta-1 isoform X1 n=1 Tax=Silurus meridionalis TaxID=175797 RepID=UPI001EEBF775|nr:liprin-beta-1 isoform X1 [Silurus meridionalis]